MNTIEDKVKELRLLMKQRPEEVDQVILKKGRALVSVFFDENFGPGMPAFRSSKENMIRAAILDLSNGGPLLKTSRLGIIYYHSEFELFSVPYGEVNPAGTIAGTISLKSRRAFEAHRSKTPKNLEQDEINEAIYYLIYLLARS